MLIVGITGGICSGKSAVSEYLTNKKFHIIDCDKITDNLYKDEEFLSGIYNLFGKKIIYNGVVNRGRLGALVFSDLNAMQRLNNYCLPFILEDIKKQLDMCMYENREVVFIDAPILFESGLDKLITFNEIWVISVEIYTQIRRLRRRKSYLSNKAIKNILNSQLSNIDRCKRANYIINNDRSSRRILHSQIDVGLNNLFFNTCI